MRAVRLKAAILNAKRAVVPILHAKVAMQAEREPFAAERCRRELDPRASPPSSRKDRSQAPNTDNRGAFERFAESNGQLPGNSSLLRLPVGRRTLSEVPGAQ